MSAGRGAPGVDGFLAGRPDDRHTAAARAFLAALRRRLPRAGLGVAGSVGRGDYTAESDLDLVVTDELRRDMSFALTCDGLGVAVFCLRSTPDPVPEEQLVSAGLVDANTPYVLHARVEDDPAGQLGRLRAALGRMVEAREARREQRLEHLRARAESLLEALPQVDDELRAGPLRVELLSAVMGAWALEHGVVLDEKWKFLRLFSTMAERDPGFHARVAEALPLRPASLPALARAAAGVIRPAAPPGGSAG